MGAVGRGRGEACLAHTRLSSDLEPSQDAVTHLSGHVCPVLGVYVGWHWPEGGLCRSVSVLRYPGGPQPEAPGPSTTSSFSVLCGVYRVHALLSQSPDSGTVKP